MDALTPEVLIVDQAVSSRKKLLTLLSRQGFDTKEAESGQSGLQSMTENTSLVFLSFSIADMPAFDALKQMKKRDPANLMRICLYSDKFDREMIATAMTHGGDAFLVHPLDPDRVLAKISKLLGQKAQPYVWCAVSLKAALMNSLILPELKVVRLTGRGAVLSASAQFTEGCVINMDCPRLAKLLGRPDTEKGLSMIVRRCLKRRPGFYLLDCEATQLAAQETTALLNIIRQDPDGAGGGIGPFDPD